ncbi:MAG: UDP-N-acetylmuramate dehydrogenase [Pseudomonadota bacterium]
MQTVLQTLSPALRERAQPGVPLAEHTTYRVGGPAALWIEPASDDEVLAICQACATCDAPLALIGNGSNIIAPDQGLDAVLLKLGGAFARIVDLDDDHLYVEAGAVLGRVSEHAQALGRSGLEWMIDIPGSLGGAVLMNAGNNEGEMRAVVERVRLLDDQGVLRELPVADCDLSYRHSRFKERGEIVLGAVLKLGPADDSAAIAARMQHQKSMRWGKFPMEFPNAGSVFKRPPGHYAGKLIQDAGLMGLRVGDAEVSTKHAGFIINRGQATASDILSLIAEVQARVRDMSGVQLEPEQIALRARVPAAFRSRTAPERP